MFGWFKNKNSNSLENKKIDQHTIVSELLSFIVSNPDVHTPVYQHGLKTEQDCQEWIDNMHERTGGATPLVYIWNENRELNTFSVSVSGHEISYWLQELNLVKREHPQFTDIRDEAILAISKTATHSVLHTVEKTGLYPSDLYSIK